MEKNVNGRNTTEFTVFKIDEYTLGNV